MLKGICLVMNEKDFAKRERLNHERDQRFCQEERFNNESKRFCKEGEVSS
jgi:hypothetical protein